MARFRASDAPRRELQALVAPLYAFCRRMVPRADEAEEVALEALRRFGDRQRDWVRGSSQEDPSEERFARVALFREAYRLLEQGWSRPMDNAFFAGRDTRPLKALEEDLLENRRLDPAAVAALAEVRLYRVDAEFRAPVVLRDILGFADDDVVEMLGVRWGVYRHRLHRGRVECIEGFRGEGSVHERRSKEA
jgi:DNA-directed RNA polymerase specialized sigma24 family protein